MKQLTTKNSGIILNKDLQDNKKMLTNYMERVFELVDLDEYKMDINFNEVWPLFFERKDAGVKFLMANFTQDVDYQSLLQQEKQVSGAKTKHVYQINSKTIEQLSMIKSKSVRLVYAEIAKRARNGKDFKLSLTIQRVVESQIKHVKALMSSGGKYGYAIKDSAAEVDYCPYAWLQLVKEFYSGCPKDEKLEFLQRVYKWGKELKEDYRRLSNDFKADKYDHYEEIIRAEFKTIEAKLLKLRASKVQPVIQDDKYKPQLIFSGKLEYDITGSISFNSNEIEIIGDIRKNGIAFQMASIKNDYVPNVWVSTFSRSDFEKEAILQGIGFNGTTTVNGYSYRFILKESNLVEIFKQRV